MSLVELIQSKALHSVYQPIVDTYRATIIGYESLIRGPQGHPLESPAMLFQEAEQSNQQLALERECVRSAVSNHLDGRYVGALFINSNPNLLCCEKNIQDLISLFQKCATGWVLELSEQHAVEDLTTLKSAIHRLRTAGIRFAIDDLGAGHSSMKLWAEIRPEYVKIDRYFIHDIHNNPYKREFVQHIVTLAKNLHATVIAEGIECIEELRQLQRMGIYAMQGYYIGKPTNAALKEAELKNVLNHQVEFPRYYALDRLIEETTVVNSSRKVSDVLDYFQQNKRLIAIPVVDQGEVKGVIRRGQFMELMSSNFGHSLYANKPAAAVMQSNCLTVDANAPIEQASALLTEHEDTLEQLILLVTKNEVYAGIIPVPSLLRRITEMRIQNARYANPLTLLPGNVPINQTIDEAILAEIPFTVLYFDLNNFKPYNDVYGYNQGDRLIQWFAQSLYDVFSPNEHFVGHVGGDDFIVVVHEDNPHELLLNLLKKQFQKDIANFYRPEHLAENSIFARARDGRFQRFPLLDYSVASLHISPRAVHSHQEVAAVAAEVKGKAKRSSDGMASEHLVHAS